MGILNTLNIGCKGLQVHGARLDIASKNIANLDTPNYIRKIPVIAATENSSFISVMNSMRDSVFSSGVMPYQSGSVAFTGVVEDPTLGEKIYRPGHPDADKDGYIMTSNVDPLVEIADATMAQRAYEASLAIISIGKSMAERATSIGQ